MRLIRFIALVLALVLAAAPVIAYFAWLGPLLVSSGFRLQAAMCLTGAASLSAGVLRWVPVRGSKS